MKIAVLDDKSYGIKQIQDIHKNDDFTLYYYDSFITFEEYTKKFDLVYLDYFLDKDGLTGLDVLEEVKKRAKKIIGFSSVEKYSKLLMENGADEYIVKK
jgi:DNA-binding response OmpR family regulator